MSELPSSITFEIQSVPSTKDPPQKEEMVTVEVPANPIAGDEIQGEVGDDRKIILVPAKNYPEGIATLARAKDFAQQILDIEADGDFTQLRSRVPEINRIMNSLREHTDTIMRVVRVRQAIGRKVVLVTVEPKYAYQPWETKTILNTDENGELIDYYLLKDTTSPDGTEEDRNILNVQLDGIGIKADSIKNLFAALKDKLGAEEYTSFLRRINVHPEDAEAIISTDDDNEWCQIAFLEPESIAKIMDIFNIKMSEIEPFIIMEPDDELIPTLPPLCLDPTHPPAQLGELSEDRLLAFKVSRRLKEIRPDLCDY